VRLQLANPAVANTPVALESMPLAADEASKLASLRAALKLTPGSAAALFCTDACLCRFLRARAWSVEKAAAMIEASLAWRKTSGVEALRYASAAQAECATGKMTRFSTRDRAGRRVLLMRPRLENTKVASGQIASLTWNVEAVVRSMGPDTTPRGAGVSLAAEQMTLVIDFRDYSVWNAPPAATSKATLSILQNHYPERLGSAILLNPPTLFYALWAILGPFVDPKTKAKVHFIDTTSQPGKALLAEHFDLAALHTSLGGSGTSPSSLGYLPWDATAYDAWAIAEEDAWLAANAR
jgi:hypothetical protein